MIVRRRTLLRTLTLPALGGQAVRVVSPQPHAQYVAVKVVAGVAVLGAFIGPDAGELNIGAQTQPRNAYLVTPGIAFVTPTNPTPFVVGPDEMLVAVSANATVIRMGVIVSDTEFESSMLEAA